MIFKDDYSGWTVIHFIQRKSEVEEKLKNYTARLRVEKRKARQHSEQTHSEPTEEENM